MEILGGVGGKQQDYAKVGFAIKSGSDRLVSGLGVFRVPSPAGRFVSKESCDASLGCNQHLDAGS